MKRLLAIVLALVVLCAPVWAQDRETEFAAPNIVYAPFAEDAQMRDAVAFLTENAGMLDFYRSLGEIRAWRVYRIAPPESGWAGLHTVIADLYGNYASVAVVFFEVPSVLSPFSETLYTAAGIAPDGDMEECATPQKILARVYDPNVFSACTVTVYDMND